MPEEDKDKQGQDGGTQDGGQSTGTADIKALLDNKDVQAEIDRRVTSALKKAKVDADARVQEALDKARKEAEEAKLLEDGKTQELYELEKKKREEAESKLAQLDRSDKVNALLDKKGVTDPEARKLFHSLAGDLTQVDAHVDAYLATLNRLVDGAVNERLKTNPPPKGGGGGGSAITSRSQFKSDAEKAEWIEKNGLEAFKKLQP